MPPDDPPDGVLGVGVGVGRPRPALGSETGSVPVFTPGRPTCGSETPPTFGDTLTPGSCSARPPLGGSVATTILPTHWLVALSSMPTFFASLPSKVIGLPGNRHSRFTEYADQVKL